MERIALDGFSGRSIHYLPTIPSTNLESNVGSEVENIAASRLITPYRPQLAVTSSSDIFFDRSIPLISWGCPPMIVDFQPEFNRISDRGV
jgi:hypothetical protein